MLFAAVFIGIKQRWYIFSYVNDTVLIFYEGGSMKWKIKSL